MCINYNIKYNGKIQIIIIQKYIINIQKKFQINF